MLVTIEKELGEYFTFLKSVGPADQNALFDFYLKISSGQECHMPIQKYFDRAKIVLTSPAY